MGKNLLTCLIQCFQGQSSKVKKNRIEIRSSKDPPIQTITISPNSEYFRNEQSSPDPTITNSHLKDIKNQSRNLKTQLRVLQKTYEDQCKQLELLIESDTDDVEDTNSESDNNDEIISKGYQELEKMRNVFLGSLLDDDVLTVCMRELQQKHPSILFVDPCLTHCIRLSSVKEIAGFLDPLKTKSYDNVFFVINNNLHWSLLLYKKDVETLFHYDSISGTNLEVGKEFANKLSNYLPMQDFVDVPCPQQNNATDCGVHVIENISKLIYIENDDNIRVNGKNITPLDVALLKTYIDRTRIDIMKTYLSERLQNVESVFNENG